MRFGMLVAYDGRGYFGYVRQPGMRTVESVLFDAISGCAGKLDLRKCRYRAATRTDRGVSALGQVVALDLSREVAEGEINSLLPEDVAVLSVREVRDVFNPRYHAVEKHYRYVCEVSDEFDAGTARRAGRLFEGRHDFRAFCRREPGRSTVSHVKRVIVRKIDCRLVMDFFARSFLWQQVRRMSSAIIAAGLGNMHVGEIEGLLSEPGARGFPPADPDGLFLVGIRYRGIRFPPEDGARRRFLGYLERCDRLVCREMLEVLKNRF
ncbi:MAG: tRNA pseudouridine(38-40) synthase TruA [Candidatus Hadarchaeales archaeon]